MEYYEERERVTNVIPHFKSVPDKHNVKELKCHTKRGARNYWYWRKKENWNGHARERLRTCSHNIGKKANEIPAKIKRIISEICLTNWLESGIILPESLPPVLPAEPISKSRLIKRGATK